MKIEKVMPVDFKTNQNQGRILACGICNGIDSRPGELTLLDAI